MKRRHFLRDGGAAPQRNQDDAPVQDLRIFETIVAIDDNLVFQC